MFTICLDDEPPELQCPADITVHADRKDYFISIPYIRPPKIRDRSSILSIVRIPAQLSPQFPLGSHQITYKVEDVWNNVAQCDFSVVVSLCLAN